MSEAGVSQTTQLSPEVQGDGTQTSPRARATSEQRREPRPAAQTPLQRGASFSPGDLRAAETEQLLCARRSACRRRGLSTPGCVGPVHSGTHGGQLGSVTPRPGAHSHHPPGLCGGHPHPSDEKTKLWGPWGPPQITLVVQGCPTQGATDKAHGREESAPRPAPQRVARRDRRRQVHTHAHGGATHTSQKAQPPGVRQRRSG